MDISSHQGFGEWVCKIVADVYLPHLHKIVNIMLPLKMVAKCHGFIVLGATRVIHIQHHIYVLEKYRFRIREFYPH